VDSRRGSPLQLADALECDYGTLLRYRYQMQEAVDVGYAPRTLECRLNRLPDYKMLPPDAAIRAEALAKIRQVVSAAGDPSGEQAERLARIEKLFGVVEPAQPESGQN